MAKAWHQTKDPQLVLQIFFWYAATAMVMPPDSISYKLLSLSAETVEKKTNEVYKFLCNKHGVVADQSDKFMDLINRQALDSEVLIMTSNFPRWKPCATHLLDIASLQCFLGIMVKAMNGDSLIEEIDALSATVAALKDIAKKYVAFYESYNVTDYQVASNTTISIMSK